MYQITRFVFLPIVMLGEHIFDRIDKKQWSELYRDFCMVLVSMFFLSLLMVYIYIQSPAGR